MQIVMAMLNVSAYIKYDFANHVIRYVGKHVAAVPGHSNLIVKMLLCFYSVVQIFLLSTSALQCKNYPGDPGWPNATSWQALNETVGGRLSTPTPLGAVCHPSNPNFNNRTCSVVLSEWSNTSFIATNPFLADYNDESCPPTVPDSNCSTNRYPAYTIAATDAADVQAGINFARTNNLRLVIKGTGHDYPGRSSGAGSLSIHTHNIRGIDVTLEDPVAVRYGGVASVKIAAGHRWGEVYVEVTKHNITVIGGSDPSVGVGGWILNGGHSPLSSTYGLGADQILALEVVTADGQHLNLNETSYPDLFWALRGGGGSTYAVMLSVTVKAYPPTSLSLATYFLATTADSDEFWSMMAYFHSQIPSISEAGGAGYHYLTRGPSIGMPAIDALSGVWLFPNKTPEQLHAVLDPVFAAMNASDWATIPLYLAINSSGPLDANTYLSMDVPEKAGISGRLGSWLMDDHALTSNFTKLKENLKAANPDSWTMISHVVAGPGVRNAVENLPGGSNAVLPAWRKAYDHLGRWKTHSLSPEFCPDSLKNTDISIVLVRSWPTDPQNTTIKSLVTEELRNSSVPALKALGPNSGAYINEADPSNTDWKHDYFGSNYDRLLSIKHKYDESGVFWCKPCVGWDEWQIIDGNPALKVVNWGIGQGAGKLCRRT